MSNFIQMQDNISAYILRDDVATYVKLAINRAIAKYSKSRFWFDETTDTFDLVQGTWFYGVADGVPDDIRQIDYMRITVNNVYYHVNQRDIQYVIDANVNNNQGQPVDWAWYNESIYFYPVPQSDYPITLFYQKNYPELVDPTDSNSFTEIPEAAELIENEALYWLYKKVILDPEKAQEYKIAAADSLKVLNQINESITGVEGSIKPTRW
jgi:hypothetical protein